MNLTSKRKKLNRLVKLYRDLGDVEMLAKAEARLDELKTKAEIDKIPLPKNGQLSFKALQKISEIKGSDLPPPLPDPNAQPRDATLGGIGKQLGSGIIEGVANTLGAPVDIMGAGLNALLPNVVGQGNNFLGSQAFKRSLDPLIGRQSSNSTERVTRRVGEEIGAATIPAGALTARSANPIRFALGELGLASGGGLAAGATAEAGGGELAQLAASTLAPLSVTSGVNAAAAGMRGILRGGQQGVDKIKSTVEQFKRAGTEPSLSQALKGLPGQLPTQFLTSTVGSIPGGQGVINKFSKNQQTQLERKVKETANKITPKQDTEIAGLTVGKGLGGKGGILGEGGVVDRFKVRGGQLYNKVADFVGPNTPTRIDRTIAYLTEKVTPKKGAEATTGDLINPKLARILKNLTTDSVNGEMPYDAIKAVRTDIGELRINGPFEDIPRKGLDALYAVLSEDMFEQARRAGPEAEKVARRADDFWKNGMRRYDDILKKVANMATPEKIFGLFNKGDEKFSVIRNVMRSLKPNERDVVAGTLLSRMGRLGSGAADNFGEGFSFSRFMTRWNDVGKKSRRLIFSSKNARQYTQDLDALAATMDNLKEGASVLANPSGTGARVANTTAFTTLATGLVTLNPLLIAGVGGGLLAANQVAKLITSPTVVRFLARNTKTPKERLLTQGARFAQGLADPDLQDAFNEYLEAVRSDDQTE